MSALAGMWNFDGKPDAGLSCARMLTVQSIYGPHDEAQWDMGSICVGRRLFRSLPEDSYDNQPLAGGDGRYILIADVRLDNRDELIGTLQIPPDRARVLADSAVLLAAWERWQDDCFDHLVGDYAFALWDRSAQRLVLARDPLGMRPLHYHRGKSFLAFASMPKGLHALPEIPRQPDEERVAEHLALLPESGPQSFFKNIERVEAGCCVAVTAAGLTSRRHWEPQRKLIKLAGPEEYAEALRGHFDQAVRSQLRGAGETVGAHLSSGFDSSAVASSAAIQMARTGGKVVAFTAVPRQGYDGPTPHGRHGDEGPIAARTAALYSNMEHVRIRGGDRSPLANLDRNFFLYDRPVLNLCNATWSNAINDAAQARKLTVMLTGQMGNMSISYGGETLLPQLMRTGRWFKWAREGTKVVRKGHMRTLGVLSATFGPYTPLPLWRWINKVVEDRAVDVQSYSAINPKRLAELDMQSRARARALDLSYRPRKDGFETRLWVLRRVDLGNYRAGTLAGWGLDQRDPTADRRLIEFCLAVPEEQLLLDGETKALARRAFAGRLAPEVIGTRRKGYQAVDWHEGLTAAHGSLREEVARLEDCGPAAEAIDLARLKALVEDWPQGGWETDRVMRLYRSALLRAVSTGHFLRRASGSNA
ncbi:MAG TPA: asparagine synthase-related protein [Rhizomicrobium sp.]